MAGKLTWPDALSVFRTAVFMGRLEVERACSISVLDRIFVRLLPLICRENSHTFIILIVDLNSVFKKMHLDGALKHFVGLKICGKGVLISYRLRDEEYKGVNWGIKDVNFL